MDRFPPACSHGLRERRFYGAVAQLGERLHGMQEVVGSTPISSTKISHLNIGKGALR